MPIQIPKLDDRSYDEILAEAVARIPVHTPEWNNFNDSDPGMTLVQLFAFMSDALLYRSNRMPEATRLKFLKLLGIPLQPAMPARGLVVFVNERGPASPIIFTKNSALYAGKVPFRTRTAVNILPVEGSVFYKQKQSFDDLDESVRTRYRNLYEEIEDDDDLKDISFYQAQPLSPPEPGQNILPEVNINGTYDTLDGALWLALMAPKQITPEHAVKLIGSEVLSLGVYPAERAIRKEMLERSTKERDVTSALSFDAAILKSRTRINGKLKVEMVRLEVESAEDVLETPGIVQVKLPDETNLIPYKDWDFDPIEEGVGELPPFIQDQSVAERIVLWIRIQLSKNVTDITDVSRRGRISYVGVNAARVVQSLVVENERLGIGTGTPNQTFKVTNTPIITEFAPDSIAGQAPSEQSFELQVIGQTTETWRMTDDLYAAKPTDKVYSLDPESGQVMFGDGLRGARPPRGASIFVSYEYGGGPDGKVAIAAINKSPLLPSGVKVMNPVRTWGASASETAIEGERRISSYLRHKDRLVTMDDYYEITRRTPGVDIGRVEVLPLFQPSSNENDKGTGITDKAGCITVMVIPDHPIEQTTPPIVTPLFLQTIADWLAPRRLVTTQVYIQAPTFIQLAVSIGLVTLQGYSSFEVLDRVKKAIRRYLSPLVGGLLMTDKNGERTGTGWQLETQLSVQDIVAEASRVEGVRYVMSENVKMGIIDTAGVTTKQSIIFKGLQLPWLSIIDVQEGDPTSLDDLGGNADPNTDFMSGLPVPLLPTKC